MSDDNPTEGDRDYCEEKPEAEFVGGPDKPVTVGKVEVRWFDGYKEVFNATHARVGDSHLWMRLEDGDTRWIPLQRVRWHSGVEEVAE